MILFLYNLVLVFALLLSAPWWLWKMATTHKYRVGFWSRLVRVPARLRAAASGRRVIWLHAVSVGEVLAVSRLAGELTQAFPEDLLLISTTTRTGQELAQKRFGPERVFYCPLDLPWAVRAYMEALRPRMLILAETEFWPNLLAASFRRGIPVAVVNARISDRSWPRYRRLRSLWRPILGGIRCVLAQSEEDAKRLAAIGCAPERLSVAGNLKFDVKVAAETAATTILRHRARGLRVVVAGSTLEGEEAALLDAWPTLLAGDPRLVLVIAPRHPERFAAVADLLEKAALSWSRRSAWSANDASPIAAGHVVLLDTIGELASIYSLAAVAFVGGSLVPAGGHNPLEPAQFGVPIVMGPSYQNFRAIAEELLAHQAMKIAPKELLPAVLAELLRDSHAAAAMGTHAKAVFTKQAGATARCVEAIRLLMAETIR